MEPDRITLSDVVRRLKVDLIPLGFKKTRNEFRRVRGEFAEGLFVHANGRNAPEMGVCFSACVFADFTFRTSLIDPTASAGSSFKYCEIHPDLGWFRRPPDARSWFADSDAFLESSCSDVLNLFVGRALPFFAPFSDVGAALAFIEANPHDLRLNPMPPDRMIADIRRCLALPK